MPLFFETTCAKRKRVSGQLWLSALKNLVAIKEECLSLLGLQSHKKSSNSEGARLEMSLFCVDLMLNDPKAEIHTELQPRKLKDKNISHKLI
jgi:hypothetical protein